MKKVKKAAKSVLGNRLFLKLAILQKQLLPKIKNEKTVAFLIGFSKWKHDFMRSFLVDYNVKFISEKESLDAIINKVTRYENFVFMVWGYKESKELKQFVESKNIPFYRIEDGFIRSVKLGAEKSRPLSLCIDSQGLYYDATQPSDLEDLLNTYDFKSNPELIKRAKNAIKKLNDLAISKYNNVSSRNIEEIYEKKTKKRILVIGQVEDDESIKRGCNREINNNDLVWIAKTENPDAEIIYKPHPDVLFGKRKMQSNPNDVRHIAKVITEPLSLADSLKTIDHVYTITSLSGFEALMRGIPVTTIGAPFYSGWGLTDDRQKVERRKRKLSLEEVFAAAYILYTKYQHPFTKDFIEIEEAIELIFNLKKINEQTEEPHEISSYVTYTFNPQKPTEIPGEFDGKIGILSKGILDIPHLDEFLDGEIIRKPKDNNEKLTYIAGWGKKQTAQKAIDFGQKHNVPYLALEDGFIRSVGLGVEGDAPLSICVDNIGIYYDATKPSRLEVILNSSGWETEELLKQAEKAINLIKTNYLSKYNNAPMVNPKLFENSKRERVLVVDQTFGDMSITLGMADKSRFLEMYNHALIENPNADIYVKTHPDVLTGKKQGNLTKNDVNADTTFIYENINPLSLLEYMDKVYVVTSQMGFEALLLDKEVHCFGMPFYAGWGLTVDKIELKRRQKKRNILELFAAAYILYTRYINPETGKRGNIFDVIEFLVKNKRNN